MLSGKSVLLMVIGSFIVLLGALATLLLPWFQGEVSVQYLAAYVSSSTSGQRITELTQIESHLSDFLSLADAAPFSLSLAILGLGLHHLLKGRQTSWCGYYRWLAILGLLFLACTTLGTVMQVLIENEQVRLGLQISGEQNWWLNYLLLNPGFWSKLVGFLLVLWGSFLRQQPEHAQVNSSL